MRKLTIKDIKELKPCYCPTKYLPKNWKGTVLDILNINECPAEDRIWVALRLLPRAIIEVFTLDCAFSAYAYANANVVYAYANAVDAHAYVNAVDATDAAAYAVARIDTLGVYAATSAAHAAHAPPIVTGKQH